MKDSQKDREQDQARIIILLRLVKECVVFILRLNAFPLSRNVRNPVGNLWLSEYVTDCIAFLVRRYKVFGNNIFFLSAHHSK